MKKQKTELNVFFNLITNQSRKNVIKITNCLLYIMWYHSVDTGILLVRTIMSNPKCRVDLSSSL